MQVQYIVVRLPSVVLCSVIQVTGTLSLNYEDHLNVSFKDSILNWPQIFCEITIDLCGKRTSVCKASYWEFHCTHRIQSSVGDDCLSVHVCMCVLIYNERRM